VRDQISEYLRANGWSLHWNLSDDFLVAESAIVKDNDPVAVVEKVFSWLRDDGIPLRVRIYSGNNSIVVAPFRKGRG